MLYLAIESASWHAAAKVRWDNINVGKIAENIAMDSIVRKDHNFCAWREERLSVKTSRGIVILSYQVRRNANSVLNVSGE